MSFIRSIAYCFRGFSLAPVTKPAIQPIRVHTEILYFPFILISVMQERFHETVLYFYVYNHIVWATQK